MGRHRTISSKQWSLNVRNCDQLKGLKHSSSQIAFDNKSVCWYRYEITYSNLAFFIQRALRSRFDCFLKWKALSCIVEVLSTRSSIRSPLSSIFSMLSTIMVRTWIHRCETLLHLIGLKIYKQQKWKCTSLIVLIIT